MVSVFSIYKGWRVSQQSAKRDEVSLLRGEVARLQRRVNKGEGRISLLEYLNTRLQEDVRTLREYSTTLRTMMIARGVTDIPEMPHLNSDEPYRPPLEPPDEKSAD